MSLLELFMRAIYAVYNRKKCEELDTIVRMIDGFENREQEMVDACYKKYAIVGPDAHTPQQCPQQRRERPQQG